MNKEEESYLQLVRDVIETGHVSDDRTGVGTHSLFAPRTLHFSLENDAIPVMTSRRTFFRGAVEELLWMMRGDTDASLLQEKNIHIWDGNTTKDFIKNRKLSYLVPENNIGTLYGFQLRNWDGDFIKYIHTEEKTGIDQLERVVDLLRKDKTSRRAVISFYNVNQIETGVLEPCHLMYIFYVNQENNKLSCHLTVRSWDLMCGAPINIIWTALFTKLIARMVGLEAEGIGITGVNCHVYKSHIDQAKKQLERIPYSFPKVKINREVNEISDLKTLQYEDFELLGYSYYPPIKYEMAI